MRTRVHVGFTKGVTPGSVLFLPELFLLAPL
jgi:hypothetical protein